MTIENVLVLAILGGALVLFISDRLRVDLVALLVLVFTTLTGLVTVEEAFSGFANPAVVTVWAVFILSGALNYTGIADVLAQGFMRIAGTSPLRLTAMVMLVAGGMSAFMNNVGAVAILLPAVISVCRRLDIAPSKLLIPLAFSSMLGGNLTLIGTPPNLLAVALMEQHGIEPFGFFDFTPIGSLVMAAGVVYMVTIGRFLLPDRRTGGAIDDTYQPIREVLTEVIIEAESHLVGEPVNAVRFGLEYDLAIIHVRRGNEFILQASDRRLQEGDILLVEGPLEEIIEVQRREGWKPLPDLHRDELREELTESSAELVELSLARNASYLGHTLREIGFRGKYGVTVLAIRRAGRLLFSHVAAIPLRLGDVLLIQAASHKLKMLRNDPNFIVLRALMPQRNRLRKAPLALGILVGTLVIITAGWLHVATAMLIGAVLLVLTNTITMDEAYKSIDWQSIFLIAGMLPLGIAMENTGTATLLANSLIRLLGGYGDFSVLIGIFLLTAALTNVISNAATTVLIVPIAIDAALALGVDPHPFVMATVIAASNAFITPIGHQSNVLVFAPGGYTFFDYTRVGFLLNVLILLVVVLAVPRLWPL